MPLPCFVSIVVVQEKNVIDILRRQVLDGWKFFLNWFQFRQQSE